MEEGLTTHKFVAVLNKKIPVGMLMNALGHMAAGISANYSSISEAGLEYYGICMFGEKEKLSVLTRKFSLWK